MHRERYEGAKRFYEDVLGLRCLGEGVIYEGTRAEALMATYPVGALHINLMTPTGPNSVILNRDLEKRRRGIFYSSFCVAPDDLKGIAERCKEYGIRVVGPTGEETWETHFFTVPRTMPNHVMHKFTCDSRKRVPALK